MKSYFLILRTQKEIEDWEKFQKVCEDLGITYRKALLGLAASFVENQGKNKNIIKRIFSYFL